MSSLLGVSEGATQSSCGHMTPLKRVAYVTCRTKKKSRAARPARRRRSEPGRRRRQSRRRGVRWLLRQRQDCRHQQHHHHQSQQQPCNPQASTSNSLTVALSATLRTELLSAELVRQQQPCSSWILMRLSTQQPAAHQRHHPGSSQLTTGWCARSQRWVADLVMHTRRLLMVACTQQHYVVDCHAGGHGGPCDVQRWPHIQPRRHHDVAGCNGAVSPMTSLPLARTELIPNHALRNTIEASLRWKR